jgi:hypothetical protein
MLLSFFKLKTQSKELKVKVLDNTKGMTPYLMIQDMKLFYLGIQAREAIRNL